MPRLSFMPIDGKVPDSIRMSIHKFVSGSADKRLFIEYGQYKDRRTLQQNDFYKGVLVPAFAEFLREYGAPVSEAQADLVLKDGVGYVDEIVMPDGVIKRVPKSTKDMNKEQMAEFITSVIAWALTEWNCQLEGEDYEQSVQNSRGNSELRRANPA